MRCVRFVHLYCPSERVSSLFVDLAEACVVRVCHVSLSLSGLLLSLLCLQALDLSKLLFQLLVLGKQRTVALISLCVLFSHVEKLLNDCVD